MKIPLSLVESAMQFVNIHQAKTHLLQLVERASAGEEIIIAKAGKPMAKLVAYQGAKEPRRPGVWKGKVLIKDDFDELPPYIMKTFGSKGP